MKKKNAEKLVIARLQKWKQWFSEDEVLDIREAWIVPSPVQEVVGYMHTIGD